MQEYEGNRFSGKEISDFTGGLITVKEAPLAEEDDKEGEIISTILKRKVSDFSQSTILNSRNRESIG